MSISGVGLLAALAREYRGVADGRGELAGLKGKGSALKAAGAPSNGELVVEFGSK